MLHSSSLVLILVLLLVTATAADDQSAKKTKSKPNRSELVRVVKAAFIATHDGWSSDEVVLQDKLNAKFVAHCRQEISNVDEFQCNWTLMNLRKAGKLSDIKSTKRRRDRHDEYFHAAEIAARHMYDKYKLTTDRVLCDPKHRKEFDKVAHAVTPDVSAYLLRKAALGLRKARRLRPELVIQIADWGKKIVTLPANKIIKDSKLVPQKSGIYIFRDPTGYLYIGESSNLRIRVSKHLDHSDRKSLAHHLWKKGADEITLELHIFDADSQAKSKTVRRAYESELIRSRKPRFNIAP